MGLSRNNDNTYFVPVPMLICKIPGGNFKRATRNSKRSIYR